MLVEMRAVPLVNLKRIIRIEQVEVEP